MRKREKVWRFRRCHAKQKEEFGKSPLRLLSCPSELASFDCTVCTPQKKLGMKDAKCLFEKKNLPQSVGLPAEVIAVNRRLKKA